MLSFKTKPDFYGIKEASGTNRTLNNGIIFTAKKNPQICLNEKRFAIAGIIQQIQTFNLAKTAMVTSASAAH